LEGKVINEPRWALRDPEIAGDTISESTADIDLLVRPLKPIAVVTVT